MSNLRQIASGTYEVSRGHPYNHDVLDLVSCILDTDAKKCPNIHEVISCIDLLTSGKSLPPRQRNPVDVSNQNDPNPPTSVCLPQ